MCTFSISVCLLCLCMSKKMKQLQHFYHSKHSLVFYEERIYSKDCWGCKEPILGPSYSCKDCWPYYYHHKYCAKLPLGLLHHPFHPLHPFILFAPWITSENIRQFYNFHVYKDGCFEYTYHCYHCNFNLHIKCGSLVPTTKVVEVHNHLLIPYWKWMMFAYNLCVEEDKGMPHLCNLYGFRIHTRCVNFPGRLKVVQHNHPLNLIHFIELHQSYSQFMSSLFSKSEHKLWALLLLQMLFCYPP